jgi:thiol-disulfide isomerase/thioredoxin
MDTTSRSARTLRHLRLVLAAGAILLLLAASQPVTAQLPPGFGHSYTPTNGDFEAVVKSVVTLVRSGDAKRFAADLAASSGDWNEVVATNSTTGARNDVSALQKNADRERKILETSAVAMLARAAALHLDLKNADFRADAVKPRFVGNVHYDSFGPGVGLPWIEHLEVVLHRAGEAGTNNEFRIAVSGLIKFPAGWRCSQGIAWTAFPASMVDDKTKRDLLLLNKARDREAIAGADDPALLEFSAVLVKFVRDGDTNALEKALPAVDAVWRHIQKAGGHVPSRSALEHEIGRTRRDTMNAAAAFLAQMKNRGIDLKDADVRIEQASLGNLDLQGEDLDGAMGGQLAVKLNVRADGTSANGAALTGEYILAADTMMRLEDHWALLGKIYWQSLPAGVLNPKEEAQMSVDNYVAEHGALPAGTVAPEIEFQTLDGAKKTLADFRGKVAVLDFWATWCGPCQEPMAELQVIVRHHPEWTNRVVVMPISIDDRPGIVRQHVEPRGWTNTFNVWAGEGDFHSAPAEAFRIRGVPTTYIIDGTGRIVLSGHPSGMPIEQTVEGLLR